MGKDNLQKELEKLRAENKKLKSKLKPKQSYVDENMAKFKKLSDYLHKNFLHKNNKGEAVTRYFFTRPAKRAKDQAEICFKLNVFVRDLIEFKAKQNDPDNAPARISMDEGSLITFLSKGRKKRNAKAHPLAPDIGIGIDPKYLKRR